MSGTAKWWALIPRTFLIYVFKSALNKGSYILSNFALHSGSYRTYRGAYVVKNRIVVLRAVVGVIPTTEQPLTCQVRRVFRLYYFVAPS